jgi:dTDP-4-dehydrorhamnose reductase
MKILLIGKNGQIGHELHRLLSNPALNFIALDYPDIDLADPDSIITTLRTHQPSLVVNAAAYTAVDKAESEPDLAMAINGIAPGIIAGELKKTGGSLVHYSTDYVFDGKKNAPYTEGDRPNPLSTYGRTKLAGEAAVRSSGAPHLLIRTSWVYGSRGANFLHTVLRLAREREELRIVDDQVGAPTWSRLIAQATVDILSEAGAFDSPHVLEERGGLYHLTASGETTWYGFARKILDFDPRKSEQVLQRLTPIPTHEYPTPARRPLNSRLDCTAAGKAFGTELPPWDESLPLVMREL